MENKPLSVVMLGASGAVGGQALGALLEMSNIAKITLLGRRTIPGITSEYAAIEQHVVDIHQVDSYSRLLNGHDVAICTLGVGEPSKMNREDFVKIDKTAVADFGQACKQAGIEHFELLSSVGADAASSSFYLRTKGELNNYLKGLIFKRLSIFQPSMILTPTNRYGITQAIVLKLWPMINPLLIAGMSKYKGVKVEDLGRAMALNVFHPYQKVEELHYADFQKILRMRSALY